MGAPTRLLQFTISLLALPTEAAPSVFRGTWLLRATDTWRIGGRPPTATLTGSLLSLCRQSASSKRCTQLCLCPALWPALTHCYNCGRSFRVRTKFQLYQCLITAFSFLCVTSLYYSASYSSLSVL